MSERAHPERTERIIVALDTAPLEEATLETAAALASALDAELHGLYVEDANLMRIAALPFTRELGLASAALRPFDASELERALKLQAGRLREALEAVASALNLRWSFQTVRGQVLSAVLACVREPDLIVFGRARRGAFAKSMSLPALGRALAGREARGGPERFKRLGLRSIALPFDGTPEAWRALAVAHALAATAKTRLALLVAASSRAEFEQLCESVRAWLDVRRSIARYAWLRSADIASIAAAADAEDAAVLICHDRTLPQDRGRFDALLAALRCPLVLIG